MSVCTIERREADPRYDYRESSYDPSAPLLPPQCGHAACVSEDGRHRAGECSQEHPADCPHACCLWSVARASCELNSGHAGGHLFSDEPERRP